MRKPLKIDAKLHADGVESKLQFSEPVTFDLLAEKKEVKQQLDEAITKAHSLQIELLESNEINIFCNRSLKIMTLQINVFTNH